MTNRESKSDRRSPLPEDGNAAHDFLRLLARKVIHRPKNRASTTRNQRGRVPRVRGKEDRANEG